MARSTFRKIFDETSSLGAGFISIENTLSTDHETFDYYKIPAFQFIQDALNYGTLTHHTTLDFPEYVPEEDMKKNAIILAWTLYYLSESEEMIPRKTD